MHHATGERTMPTSTAPTCRRASRLAAAVALAASLAACGGSGNGSPPDPLQKYRTQAVQWAECDATIIGPRSPKLDALWALAGERLRCAQVSAPLDWADPGRGDITLAVMRLAAGTPPKRRGALLFNPGGPGGDGLDNALRLLGAFALSDPDSPQGAQQLRLLAEYDMVGFSPRGLGASTRLHCATNELERFVDYSPAGWDTPANLANAHYNGRKTAEACGKNPLTPYINTDATARDLDLLRGLLGDDRLNYLGYSYGTWLGAWYASLFPEKVGRMVLDSALDFGTTLEKSLLHSQPPARQRLFDEVMVPYAVRHPNFFRLGATGDEVRAVMPRLHPRVQAVLAESLSGLGYNRADAMAYLGHIAAARGLDAALQSVPDAADASAVRNALAQQVFDPDSSQHDALLHEAAWTLYGRYRTTWLAPEAHSIQVDGAAGVAIRCNDTPAITDLAQWTATVRGAAQQAPMYFGGLLALNACAFWGGPSVHKPSPAAMQQLPVLFVQTQYDAATNTDGANTFFAQLPGARRVYVTGDFQHGVYPYADGCVDPQVTAYLLGEAPAQRETVCPGKPLEGEDQAAAQKAQPADGTAPVYTDPEKARALIDEFKRSLVPPSLRP